ncbi:DUF3325 domain-containing protein [Steroidobacter sp.]|uniref:DUF3325 domain-containing protein n=1 Tax=Steroidobacter sp. TaxID=1978227 RepID=UPI001A6427E3|nr:DUF3325 domain-containing protein [Steroidobacter sp.]MBL8265026.1 DUF3325 domain-containing protein [Steroidobacter sp.]
MREVVMLVASLLACVLGFASLALAMEPHWRQVRGDVPIPRPTVIVLRVLGGVALFASLLLCLRVDHASMASLVWVMALAGAALIVAFTLAWRPRMWAWLVAWTK